MRQILYVATGKAEEADDQTALDAIVSGEAVPFLEELPDPAAAVAVEPQSPAAE